MAEKSVRIKRGVALKIGSAAAAAIVAEVVASLPAQANGPRDLPINMTCFSSAGTKNKKSGGCSSASVHIYMWEVGQTEPAGVPNQGSTDIFFDNRKNAGEVDVDIQCKKDHDKKHGGILLVVTT